MIILPLGATPPVSAMLQPTLTGSAAKAGERTNADRASRTAKRVLTRPRIPRTDAMVLSLARFSLDLTLRHAPALFLARVRVRVDEIAGLVGGRPQDRLFRAVAKLV